MEEYNNRNGHIDAIRKHFGITLAAVSRYNSQHGDEIKNSCKIFHLKGSDKEKVRALLCMISAPDDTRYNSDGSLVDKYGTMLAAALIYNPQFYAMAVNYYEAINAGFSAGAVNNVIRFPINSGNAFAAAAVFIAVLFVALLVLVNSRTGQRINNEWIAGLTIPQKGQDGVSFVSDGDEGVRIGIKSPLVGIAMAAGNKPEDLSAVVAYYTKAIKAGHNNASLYVNRGIAYTLQGYVDSAIKDFSKAIELDPYNAPAYFNRAVAYIGKGHGETQKAIDDLMTVITLNPGDSEAYYTLGVLYFRQYEEDEAKPTALLKRALDAFSHIQGYKDADIIFDYLSRLL